jgi:nucleoside-diphosphate-sugar epimerase
VKKIIITGSTGFIGRNLVPKLISQGYVVLEITRDIEKSNRLFGEETEKIQIDDLDFKEKIVAFKPDFVVHLAAYLTASDEWSDIVKLIDSNLLFLSKILNAIAETSLKLFINTGTFAEYYLGNDILDPAYFYASTKTASRSFISYFSNAYNFKFATVVPYTIYGGVDSNKKIIDILIESTSSDNSIDLSPGDQILDFIHINDVTDFYLTMIEKESIIPNKSNFHLGTGIGHSIKDLAKLIDQISCKKTNINWGGKEYRKSDVMYAVADTSEQFQLLSWTPKISLYQGLLNYF